MAVMIIVGVSIALILGFVIWLRRSSAMGDMRSPDPGKRRRARFKVWGGITAVVLFPLLAIVGWVAGEEWLYFKRIEARVAGIERVCVVETRSPRRGRDRWNDQTGPMACQDALAQVPRFGANARLGERERIDYVSADGALRGYVLYTDPPSPFRPGQSITVLHPNSGEGSGRRPQAME